MFTFCEGSHGDNKIIQAMATEANIKPSEKSYLLERLHRSVNIMSLLALLSRKLVLHLPCPLLLLPFNGHASPIMAAKLVHGFSDTHTHTHIAVLICLSLMGFICTYTSLLAMGYILLNCCLIMCLLCYSTKLAL